MSPRAFSAISSSIFFFSARCMPRRRSCPNTWRHWTLWTGNTTQASRSARNFSMSWQSFQRFYNVVNFHLQRFPRVQARQREMIKSYTTGAYSQTYNAYQQVFTSLTTKVEIGLFQIAMNLSVKWDPVKCYRQISRSCETLTESPADLIRIIISHKRVGFFYFK